MVIWLRNKLSDEFVRNNAVFFVGSLLVAALNYLYHPIISRLLTVEQFGEVQGYLSVAMQFGVIITVFGMVVINIKTRAEKSEQSEIVAGLYSAGMLVALVIAVGILVLSPWLAKVFELPSYWAWFFVALISFLGMPRAFARAHLQAEKRFGLLSGLELLVAAGKIVFALILFWLGFEVLGAVGGFVLTTLIGLLVAYPYAKSTLAIKNLSWPHLTPSLRAEFRYGGLVLAAIGFTTFLYTADILLMRYFFSAEIAGQYAGIATVARIIIFATASVSGVLLAHVTRGNSEQENRHLLKKGLVMVGGIGGGALVVFAAFPQFIVSVLMGANFLPLAHLLPLLSLTMFLVAIVNLMVMYCVALRMYSLFFSVSAAALTIALGTFLWHAEVSDVVTSFIAGLTVALLLLSWQISTHRG